MKIIFGIFFILHGLVHFFYFGHSSRFFELKPGLKWPDDSWIFSKLLKKRPIRIMAGNFCILSMAGFIIGGVEFLTSHPHRYILIISSAIFSSITYLFFWNGKFEKLGDQGAIGVLINLFAIMWVLAN